MIHRQCLPRQALVVFTSGESQRPGLERSNAVHRMGSGLRWAVGLGLAVLMWEPGWLMVTPAQAQPRGAQVTQEQVEKAIRLGVKSLRDKQQPDGSWRGFADDFAKYHGLTSLATLALINAGEPIDSPTVSRALEFIRRARPDQLDSTYAVALQVMALAAGDPQRDKVRIAAGVAWLERAQFRREDSPRYAGAWTYGMNKGQRPDNSNSQFALLGLYAASEVGVEVKDSVWELARNYWERCQNNSGGWPYVIDDDTSTASMTCAGISSLVITGAKRVQSVETLVGDKVRNCGEGGVVNNRIQAGINWMARRFQVDFNFTDGLGRQPWTYYYLYGLERAGRLSGQRYFGEHDWYLRGAAKLVKEQDPLLGSWNGGGGIEDNPVLVTSYALLFLAKGRAPVLINKLVHQPANDWNIHVDDIRNLTNAVSRDWKAFVTWQVVNPNSPDAGLADLLQAPIAFINGKQAPVFTPAAKRLLRDYVEQGGFILAEAGCSEPAFDQGFRALLTEIFPEPDYQLRRLSEDHPIWRSYHRLSPNVHELWGIEFGCRTVVVYTPQMLAAYWNHAESQPGNPAVERAIRVGQNIVDYATGRELPEDKLKVREIRNFKTDDVKRGALRIAKLRHAGDWNVAPLAIPNLTTALRDQLGFDVVINHKELLPRDPNLIYYPLIYVHGRASLSFTPEDMEALRKHLDPGRGLFFADAACGSPAFDAAFRKFVAELLPNNPLEPIPPDDELFNVVYDLNAVEFSKAAGGRIGPAELEGVKINGRWVVIYSKYDLGCALERHQGSDCKGYKYESALKIVSNIVVYSTLP
ncbi:Prenyltransferase/squalene oxidase [Isosphaera pallida ATCC 43644]|uniref:Prenyltransferase/squalene oxidase n=1 Tax=Isosphaera pallida (strain ATCC 43644 / DSM 9630 / IS1B) TaxID=575540 RepID=E8QYM8_ISOPI|nr:DUF4159 domain-containing protein [Isosphaera pallida]ADV61004.1 Prenyltransferase/squalene oxidase [Isosphaera pallida ATCC 43644]